jgi:hypothetical protein
VIVFPGPMETVPVPRWKRAGSVAMFPSGNPQAGRRTVLARVVSIAKTVFMWLRTGEVRRHDVGENFPPRKRVAGQTTQPEGRTAGH